ncbi:hypothetical protein DID96_08490 [Burkholderia sp. Bp8963]|nr:hypothetical protein DID96_08490 [Burkholderia sp. Bp8963]
MEAGAAATAADTRMPVGMPARACACNDASAALATTLTPIRRAALLIQPHSFFCILLVGELPTVFPTAWSVKGECNGRLLRTPTG